MGDLVIKEEIFKKWTPLSKGEGTETLSRPRSNVLPCTVQVIAQL